MFQELMPLLAQRTLIVTMSRASDDEMRINVVPRPLKSDQKDDEAGSEAAKKSTNWKCQRTSRPARRSCGPDRPTHICTSWDAHKTIQHVGAFNDQ